MSTLRKFAGSMLLYSLSACALGSECPIPAWPTLDDPATVAAIDRDSKLEIATEQQFREDVWTYVRCNRASLRNRAANAPAKVPASEIAAWVRQANKQELAALARADALKGCITTYSKAANAADAKNQCEAMVQMNIAMRLGPTDRGAVTKVAHGESPAFRGAWTYDIEEFVSRPCSGGLCERTFGMSIANVTPVELQCRVSLRPQPESGGAKGVEQTAIVPPGHTVAAAILTADLPREATVSGTAVCEEKRWPEDAMTRNCSLRWNRVPSGYPELVKRSWFSGAAMVELTANDGRAPTDLVVTDGNPAEAIGRSALNALRPLRVHTNCPGVRFRVRLEYLTFPCVACEEGGTVTLIRN